MNEPHRHREVAESFGSDPERYERARPGYPDAMVNRIVAASLGPDVLDVGCGTGIAARQLQAAGCRVLGVDPDARMADLARRHGVDVEVAAFEAWDPAGRDFDAVYRRVLPDSPIHQRAMPGLEVYAVLFTRAADGIRRAGAFGEPEQWRFDWARSYTRDEWLDQLPTFGGHSQFPPAKLEELLAGVGAAVDAVGGSFTMRYTTVVVTATRTGG